MKVIGWKYFPVRYPINITAIMWLFWDRYRPAEWATTLGAVLLGMLWIGCVGVILKQELVHPSDLPKETPCPPKP